MPHTIELSGHDYAPNIHELMQPLCENLRGGNIESCGHYIPEEQPEKLAAQLVSFFQEVAKASPTP